MSCHQTKKSFDSSLQIMCPTLCVFAELMVSKHHAARISQSQLFHKIISLYPEVSRRRFHDVFHGLRVHVNIFCTCICVRQTQKKTRCTTDPRLKIYTLEPDIASPFNCLLSPLQLVSLQLCSLHLLTHFLCPTNFLILLQFLP